LVAAAAMLVGAAPAPAVTVQLDRDRAPERLIPVSVRLPGFASRVFGRTWAVRDVVGGRRVVVPLGPAGERLGRPRLGDRNADGRREVFTQAQAGNSLFYGEIWEWNGRRARRLWRLDLAPVQRAVGPDLVLNGPGRIAFPDPDGTAVRDVIATFLAGECRACGGEVVVARWSWDPAARRWTFAGLD